MYDKYLHTTNNFVCVNEIITVQFVFLAICAEDYYQTSTGGNTLQCEACPIGSTTEGVTNSQAMSACGKCSKTLFYT